MNVTPRKWYVVTTDSECVVTDANGKVLCTATAGEQKLFYATTPVVTLSDETATVGEANFKRALAALGLLGGGNNGLPAGYTRVEYLESTQKGNYGQQYIDTGLTFKTDLNLKVDMQPLGLPSTDGWFLFGCDSQSYSLNQLIYGRIMADETRGYIFSYNSGNESSAVELFGKTNLQRFQLSFDGKTRELHYNGKTYSMSADAPVAELPARFGVFTAMRKAPWNATEDKIGKLGVFVGRVFTISASDDEKAFNFIPSLDPTGTPCMFDTVTRKPFYNNGTGDFLYPRKEEEATTYSLRRPRMYAQMTEHGIRRLYHVPKDFNGTPEEYAEQNGFKLLVETPAPEDGYWAPVWHERVDCIELEWVETEPPAEEELLTEA